MVRVVQYFCSSTAWLIQFRKICINISCCTQPPYSLRASDREMRSNLWDGWVRSHAGNAMCRSVPWLCLFGVELNHDSLSLFGLAGLLDRVHHPNFPHRHAIFLCLFPLHHFHHLRIVLARLPAPSRLAPLTNVVPRLSPPDPFQPLQWA